MKRNLWICLLDFPWPSISGGWPPLATCASRGTEKMTDQDPLSPSLQEIWGTLNLETEQRQILEGLLPEHRGRVGICGGIGPKKI